MNKWNVISGVVSTLIVASFVVSPGTTYAHENPKKPCTGHHQSDDGCSSGGGSGGAAAPVFAYRRDGGAAAKIYLANADGSGATLVFTGVKFSRTGEPSVHGDANGGTVLIETFRNLHRINYEVTDGVVTVMEDVKVLDRGDDDSGLSILAPQPQWSPDGEDFVYKNGVVNPNGTDMYIYSRATSDPDTQAITDFGDPIYSGRREANCDPVPANGKCPATHDLGWLAWDEADTIHFTVRKKDGHSWELRSFNISVCDQLEIGTCMVDNSTCIASTSTCGLNIGTPTFSHVSVMHAAEDEACTGGTAPRILVAGNDANGIAQTFVLGGVAPAELTANIQGLDGQDWTSNCTILGTIGNDVVEFDPYAAASATTLVSTKLSVPDWIN
jgi:hypothetical protein